MISMRERSLPALALLLAAAACGGSTEPISKPSGDLHFLHPAIDAAALAETSVTFYAYRTREVEAAIWYHPRPGQSDSTEFIRFKVPEQAIAEDSVQITITVVDAANMIVQFEPSGLRFDPRNPARLTIKYSEADDDLNDDGVVDTVDESLKATLALWKQETATDPWVQLPGLNLEASDEVEADIFSFTRYAVAY
jgi:hypothetical protein